MKTRAVARAISEHRPGPLRDEIDGADGAVDVVRTRGVWYADTSPMSISQQPDVAATDAPIAPPTSRRRRWIVRAAVYAAIAYVVWCIVLFFFQTAMIFPHGLAPAPLPDIPRHVRELTILTEKGHVVPAWFAPAPSASADRPGPAVLYFHGNAEIIDHLDRVSNLWPRINVSLLLTEYRGYGRAAGAGKPSQAALVADGIRFFDVLAQQPEVDPERIVIHGYSLGGGVAAQVAARRKPAALILEATFTSIADFAWSYGVPPFLARHPFRTDQVLPDLGVPILITHGRRDTIIPVRHGRQLHELVPKSTYIELDCGHLNLPGAAPGDSYRGELHKFLLRSRVCEQGFSLGT